MSNNKINQFVIGMNFSIIINSFNDTLINDKDNTIDNTLEIIHQI